MMIHSKDVGTQTEPSKEVDTQTEQSKDVGTQTNVDIDQKHVHIHDPPSIRVHLFYDEDSLDDKKNFNSQLVRESLSRSRDEKLYKQPRRNEMKRFQSLLRECHVHPLTVVFGNLGRRPRLLDYFLDLCFTHTVNVGTSCAWPTDSPYQIRDSSLLDYLFILEPYFGADAYCPPHAKHTVILTSHLCLNIPERVPKLQFQVDIFRLQRILEQKYTHGKVNSELVPRVFYDASLNPGTESVSIDVRGSSSALEAYLKLLSGREISHGLPYQIKMDSRDLYHLKSKITRSKREMTALWDNEWLRIYWEDVLTRLE